MSGVAELVAGPAGPTVAPPRPPRAAVDALYASSHVRAFDRHADVWDEIVARGAERDLRRRFEELPRTPLRVLDLGCGTGRNLHRLHRAGVRVARYVGVDASPSMLTTAQANHPYTIAELVVADVASWTPDAAFDLVVATWLLSHLEQPYVVLERARAALAPGGRLVVATVVDRADALGRAVTGHLVRRRQVTPLDEPTLLALGPRHVHRSLRGTLVVLEYRAPGGPPT